MYGISKQMETETTHMHLFFGPLLWDQGLIPSQQYQKLGERCASYSFGQK
jgi:hypothetical protein